MFCTSFREWADEDWNSPAHVILGGYHALSQFVGLRLKAEKMICLSFNGITFSKKKPLGLILRLYEDFGTSDEITIFAALDSTEELSALKDLGPNPANISWMLLYPRII